METNSAKRLDETCNCLNEAYRDEVLYTSRVERWTAYSANARIVPATVTASGSRRSTRRK